MWIVFFLLLFVLGSGVFLWHRVSLHMLRNVGSPSYSVLRREGKYEIRRYESFAVAGTKAGGSIEAAIRSAFPVLYSFVTPPSGRQQKRDVSVAGSHHEVAFVIRSDFSEPSEAIADPRVFFSVVPSRVIAAYPLRWSMFRKPLEESESLFNGFLLADRIRPVGDFELVLYSAPHAPPFFFLAELLVEIEPS